MQYRILTQSEYETYRFELLRQLEGLRLRPYIDTANPPIPTIGIGFNLKTSATQNYLRDLFGFDLSNTQDQGFWSRIVTEINATHASSSDLQQALDQIMAERAAQLGGRTTFSFYDEAEVSAALNVLVVGQEAAVTNFYSAANLPQYSWERLALLSLKYNNILGQKTLGYLQSGDRAEAWAEIRYSSNGDGDHGKRRYVEAAVFGLFAGPQATADEAENAAQMFQRRREQIEAYESTYGNLIDDANLELAAANLLTPFVESIVDELEPAKVHFLGTISAVRSDLVSTAFEGIAATDMFVGERGVSNILDSSVTSAGAFRSNSDLLIGQELMDNLSAGDGNDVLDGRDGNDLLFGGNGNDVLIGSSGDDNLRGNDGADVLDGGDGYDDLEGGAGNDQLYGGDGAEWLDAGDGNDIVVSGSGDLDGAGTTIRGGYGDDIIYARNGYVDLISDLGGNDQYFIDPWDYVIDYDSIGTIQYQDTLFVLRPDIDTGTGGPYYRTGDAALWFTRGNVNDDPATYVQPLWLIADALWFLTVTWAANPVIATDQPINLFAGEAGGGEGANGYLVGTAGADYIIGGAGNNFIQGGDGDDTLEGAGQRDSLIGGAGNDTLNGGGGFDTLLGGSGNDTYIIDNAGDVASENASEGTDLVQSSITYSLTSNVDSLTLTGAAAINGTGNELDNILTGNSAANTLTGGSGNDTLDGGLGADTLIGGVGDDIYVVDNAGDAITEGTTAGIDLVRSSVTHTLASNVENLTLTGSGAINGTGNSLDNVLTGNSGVNRLTGGLGNDTYFVSNTTDVVVESTGAGIDVVHSSVSYTISANVEQLVLTGTSAIDGTGNSSNNTITGNAGANTLNGAAGADTLVGGDGNDIYVVDAAGDVTIEAANAGTDLVQASIAYTLGSNVENLTLTGSSKIDGTGNALSNVLQGNGGSNVLRGLGGDDTLNGGAGADAMIGGSGNDTYVVAQTTDVVTEVDGEGMDSVQSSVSYTLSNFVEALTLTGAGNTTATGNSLDNFLTGNTGNNTLQGAAGNDVLDGGIGTDSLIGGTGDDAYYVDGADQVTEGVGEGLDTVYSGTTRTLAANIELLFLTGSSQINGSGNALSNLLRGNDAGNVLIGGGGTDILEGRDGNDTLSATGANALLNGGLGEVDPVGRTAG